MEFKFLNNNVKTASNILYSVYYVLSSKGEYEEQFRRDFPKMERSDSRYQSYSSMIDNLYYQPKKFRNAYELGTNEYEVEVISLESEGSFAFDRVPSGIDKVIYYGSINEESVEPLIEVKFETLSNGIVEKNYDQVVLLSFKFVHDKTEAEESDEEPKSTSVKLHEASGHRFHRAYNAIQHQDSRSVMSKMLITAIFDTYDIDFTHGTLIGGDSSKYFIGNRITKNTIPVIYEKIVDAIIDISTNGNYSGLNGKTVSEIQKTINEDEGYSALKTKLKSSSYVSIEDETTVIYCNVYKINNGSDISLDVIEKKDVPVISPVYDNEDNTDSYYITSDGDTTSNSEVFYPPSLGALFEYEKTSKENGYYYVYSPMINLGLGTFEYNPGDPSVINSLRKETFGDKSFSAEHGAKNVVGVRTTSEGKNKYLTVMSLVDSIDTLNYNEGDWVYTSSGELIVNREQIKKKYPIL